MKKATLALVMALLVALATVVPAFADPGDGNNGCHFGRGHENPWFDGAAWGENNSENAKSSPGARADDIDQRSNCRD